MDASGKTPSGILSGNTVSIGDFDQCIAVKHEIVSNNEFDGQYCQMEINLNISEIYRGNIKSRANTIDIDSIEIAQFTSVTQRRLPR